MKYTNPVIPGFFPDPSICKANGKYYMVNSTFQYFPGVPLHESEDLINWKYIGNVLTRPSQLSLKESGNSGGIFATTIRYNKGRFYMVTTNVSSKGNFYVYTDDIYGEWSEPIWIDQDGIDPSFYFEGDTCYFMTNGTDDEGNGGIIQCEIDIDTGKILSKKKRIWTGCGGRYLEGPHLYKFKDTYYLLAAEGGTEYGHMIIMATGKNPYGPFNAVEGNPVLTNRNLGGYAIQGVGHGDIVEDDKGNFWMVHLAYRQIDQWLMFHTTGRETYLVPMDIEGDKISVGINGTCRAEIETDRISDALIQKKEKEYNFKNTKLGREWLFLREPNLKKYETSDNEFKLWGVKDTLAMDKSHPTFAGLRLEETEGEISVDVSVTEGVGGLVLYMDNDHHIKFEVEKKDGKTFVRKIFHIGDMCYQATETVLEGDKKVRLKVGLEPTQFKFTLKDGDKDYDHGTGRSRYLSTEVACGFTGIMIGLYAENKEKDAKEPVTFSDFTVKYKL